MKVGPSLVSKMSSFGHTLATRIVESTNQFSVRSSKRTDIVHAYIKQYIESRNPRVSCKLEYKLETKLGNFDVDIAMFDREKLVACLLFKGLTSSISKNSKNYEHNKIGEAIKAKSGMGDAKLVYLDVIPVRCPTYGKSDDVKCWESHPPEKVRERSIQVAQVANDGRVRPIIDDVYTLSVDYAYHPERVIEFVKVVDDSDFVRFDRFIDELAPFGASS